MVHRAASLAARLPAGTRRQAARGVEDAGLCNFLSTFFSSFGADAARPLSFFPPFSSGGECGIMCGHALGYVLYMEDMTQ